MEDATQEDVNDLSGMLDILTVMAGLVPAIHVLLVGTESSTWMPGTSPGMTSYAFALRSFSRSRMLPSIPLGRKMMNSTKSTP